MSPSEQVGNAALLANIVVVARARARRDGEALAAEQRELHVLVRAARDRGVSWQTIGDTLGLRRGAAYQRFRHTVTDARSMSGL